MKRQECIFILQGILKENKKRKLHISMQNRRFYNGIIMSYEDEETLSLIDEKLGYINILYSQIINIEPMKI